MESIHGDNSSKELLEAQSHLWNLAFTYINSMSLKCAVELGIPDIIHKNGKPMALSHLSAALSIPPSKTPCFRRLMRLLVHLKIFYEHEEEIFSMTTTSEILRKEKRTSLSPFVLLALDQIFLHPWLSVSIWFKENEPPTSFEVAHGMPILGAIKKMPRFNDMLNEGMASDASFTSELILRDCGEVFHGLSSLVDVGGGTGALAHAVAEAFPAMKCTVLELPHVVAGLDKSEMVQFVSGDMFDYVPSANATLLKWVLHDWSDQECVKILERCKEAIKPFKESGGKVIIIEMVMNADKVCHELAETQFLFDLHMMAHTTGKQRSEQEWQKIFTSAGFSGNKILPVLGLRSIIEVYP